jgi:hypothetical protein
MSIENLLWGAPRIHGELLKLGFSVAQSTVATYMVRRRGSPSQGWRTFPRNHAPDIAVMDLFVVPTIGFKLLYGFVIVRLHRRDLVWINVTTNPTAEWVARQITAAFPWDGAPRYMIRDRDRIYGTPLSHADFAPWASEISQLHQPTRPKGERWSRRCGYGESDLQISQECAGTRSSLISAALSELRGAESRSSGTTATLYQYGITIWRRLSVRACERCDYRARLR